MLRAAGFLPWRLEVWGSGGLGVWGSGGRGGRGVSRSESLKVSSKFKVQSSNFTLHHNLVFGLWLELHLDAVQSLKFKVQPVTHYELRVTRHSSLLTPHPSLFTHHSSLITHHDVRFKNKHLFDIKTMCNFVAFKFKQRQR